MYKLECIAEKGEGIRGGVTVRRLWCGVVCVCVCVLNFIQILIFIAF